MGGAKCSVPSGWTRSFSHFQLGGLFLIVTPVIAPAIVRLCVKPRPLLPSLLFGDVKSFYGRKSSLLSPFTIRRLGLVLKLNVMSLWCIVGAGGEEQCMLGNMLLFMGW